MELQPLNVLIGANASGKSNLIEAFELLRAMPTNFADAIREGGGPAEWIWKGEGGRRSEIEAEVKVRADKRPLRHRLAFAAVPHGVEVSDEGIEELEPAEGKEDAFFLYRFRQGHPVVNSRSGGENGGGRKYVRRNLPPDSLSPDQSILSQLKDVDLYPEITEMGVRYGAIQSFREWTSFGRSAAPRQPPPADLPEDRLLPDARNLALVLNHIEHNDGRRFNEILKRFFPRFQRMSTKVSGGTVQFYLHEPGFKAPIPPARLSDGTLRFVALLATLLAPSPPPLVCIEEPELGLHPDAVALIAEILVEASERMQVVVTTHSRLL